MKKKIIVYLLSLLIAPIMALAVNEQVMRAGCKMMEDKTIFCRATSAGGGFGIIILIAVVILAWFLYKKYRKGGK